MRQDSVLYHAQCAGNPTSRQGRTRCWCYLHWHWGSLQCNKVGYPIWSFIFCTGKSLLMQFLCFTYGIPWRLLKPHPLCSWSILDSNCKVFFCLGRGEVWHLWVCLACHLWDLCKRKYYSFTERHVLSSTCVYTLWNTFIRKVRLDKGEESFLKLRGDLGLPEPWLDGAVMKRRGESW